MENESMVIRTPDDAAEATYRATLASLQEAEARARRLDGAQHGRPLELQDQELWREQDDAWSIVGQRRRNLIETAPGEATSWWPGGWLAVSEYRRFGYSGLPGQVPRMNIWPTQDAARAGRPDWVPEDQWTVTWTTTGRNEFGEVPLDETFWAQYPDLVFPAPAVPSAPEGE